MPASVIWADTSRAKMPLVLGIRLKLLVREFFTAPFGLVAKWEARYRNLMWY